MAREQETTRNRKVALTKNRKSANTQLHKKSRQTENNTAKRQLEIYLITAPPPSRSSFVFLYLFALKPPKEENPKLKLKSFFVGECDRVKV